MSDIETSEVSVYPTMIVGLGGTGCKIAKRLKATLHAEGVSHMNIKFVGIDTDLCESAANGAAELPLDRFITIGGGAVHFDPKDKTNGPMLSWLPKDETGKLAVGTGDLGRGAGAGGHRLVGRFAYNYFAPEQFLNLQHTVDELVDLGNNPLERWQGVQYHYLPGIAVYVVGSLVGGTGSGAFIDAIATLHDLTGVALAENKRLFTGLFLLPSVFDYRSIGSQNYDHLATAYACLKDLDLLLTRDDAKLKDFWYYNSPEPFTVSERFLDSCYLVDRYSGSGALLRDEDVYDLVVTHLYAAIGTPFGATSRSVENNSHKTGIVDESGGFCSYSAFGLVGMDYSRELLMRYCGARLGATTLDLLLGTGMPAAEAEADATSYLEQVGLSGSRGSRAAGYVEGAVGDTYIKRPETLENERTVDLYEDLSHGHQEFTKSLESGALRGDLQHNYRDHLLSSPENARKVELLPGQVSAPEPQRWKYRIRLHVEERIRLSGLRAGRQLAEAFGVALAQALQDVESGVGDARTNVQTATATFNGALASLQALTPMVEIFQKQHARETRRTAVQARNALVKARVHAEALELMRQAFNDDTDGLIPMVNHLRSDITQLVETLDTARQALEKRSTGMAAGRREGADLLGAPDRSCLLYDVLPGSGFESFYAALSDRRQQLLEVMLQGRSALTLLDPIRTVKNKAETLLHDVTAKAEPLFPEIADQHILDVITQGARDPQERKDRLRKYLRDVTPRLRPHAPIMNRRGEAATYDYCVVTYPRHEDDSMNAAFCQTAEEVVAETNVRVQIIPTDPASNRILMTYMQHGIPLNFKAFPHLQKWMAAYEHLRPRDPYLDVDQRWMKYPGPGQRAGGGAREKLFTLGLAYGLIAKQGDFFYSNFDGALLRNDQQATAEREQYEVDLKRVSEAVHSSSNPLEWFPKITLGPSDIATIPSHFGSSLGAGKNREARDRIAQGRQNAMQAFVENEGEDYGDVADAIAAVMEAYAEERGRSSVREELSWYRKALDEERLSSPSLADELQKEVNLLDELLATLAEEGSFGLPIGA